MACSSAFFWAVFARSARARSALVIFRCGFLSGSSLTTTSTFGSIAGISSTASAVGSSGSTIGFSSIFGFFPKLRAFFFFVLRLLACFGDLKALRFSSARAANVSAGGFSSTASTKLSGISMTGSISGSIFGSSFGKTSAEVCCREEERRVTRGIRSIFVSNC